MPVTHPATCEDRNVRMAELRAEGWTMAAIAEWAGVSKARVGQILAALSRGPRRIPQRPAPPAPTRRAQRDQLSRHERMELADQLAAQRRAEREAV